MITLRLEAIFLMLVALIDSINGKALSDFFALVVKIYFRG